MTDYYEILEVHPNASPEVIARVYRVLAARYHPDLHPPERRAWAEEMMKRVNEAFSVLSDPQKRADYDRPRQSAKSAQKDAQPSDTRFTCVRCGAPYARAQGGLCPACQFVVKESARASDERRKSASQAPHATREKAPCPKCGKPVYDTEQVCPFCGNVLGRNRTTRVAEGAGARRNANEAALDGEGFFSRLKRGAAAFAKSAFPPREPKHKEIEILHGMGDVGVKRVIEHRYDTPLPRFEIHSVPPDTPQARRETMQKSDWRIHSHYVYELADGRKLHHYTLAQSPGRIELDPRVNYHSVIAEEESPDMHRIIESIPSDNKGFVPQKKPSHGAAHVRNYLARKRAEEARRES